MYCGINVFILGNTRNGTKSRNTAIKPSIEEMRRIFTYSQKGQYMPFGNHYKGFLLFHASNQKLTIKLWVVCVDVLCRANVGGLGKNAARLIENVI